MKKFWLTLCALLSFTTYAVSAPKVWAPVALSHTYINDSQEPAAPEQIKDKAFESSALALISRLDVYGPEFLLFSHPKTIEFSAYESGAVALYRASYDIRQKSCSIRFNYSGQPTAQDNILMEYLLLKEVLRCTEFTRNMFYDLPDLYYNSALKASSPQALEFINKTMHIGVALPAMALGLGFEPFGIYLENKVSSEAVLLLTRRYAREGKNVEPALETIYAYEERQNSLSVTAQSLTDTWNSAPTMEFISHLLSDLSSRALLPTSTYSDIHTLSRLVAIYALEKRLEKDNFRTYLQEQLGSAAVWPTDFRARPLSEKAAAKVLSAKSNDERLLISAAIKGASVGSTSKQVAKMMSMVANSGTYRTDSNIYLFDAAYIATMKNNYRQYEKRKNESQSQSQDSQ